MFGVAGLVDAPAGADDADPEQLSRNPGQRRIDL